MISLSPRLPDVAHPRMLALSLCIHGLLLLAIVAFSFLLPTQQKTPQWNVSRVKIVEDAPGPPAIEKPRPGPVRTPPALMAEPLDQAEVTTAIADKSKETVEPRVISAAPKDSIPVVKRKKNPARVEAPKPKSKKPPEASKPKPDPQELLERKMAAIREKHKNAPDDKQHAAPASNSGGQGSTDDASAVDQELALWLEAAKGEINSRWTVFADARRIRKPTIVGVKIARDGRIADAWVDESSGEEVFDKSAGRAVSQAAPLLAPFARSQRKNSSGRRACPQIHVRRNAVRLSDRFLASIVAFQICLCSILAALPCHSQMVIDLNNPNLAKMPIAVPDFMGNPVGPATGQGLAAILRRDLRFTGLFNILPISPAVAQTPDGEPNFEACAQAGAQAVVSGRFQINENGIVFEGKLFDVALRKMELGKRFTARFEDHRQLVHRFGDRIMEALTGQPGCFTSRIAFVGDTPPKEIFGMDFDGNDLRQVTRTGSINLSPEWSPDGRNIIFTSYVNRNPDVWLLDLSTLNLRPVSARPGLNASARYSPSGDFIALSMSFQGSPKIFIINTQGHIINRLTTGIGNDISPTWSPDGSTIAYVSDHAGTPQIYTIPAQGGPARRLTLEGNYNTDPKWSRLGDLLAFTARVQGRFQICTIRPDGTDLRVLTSSGSNQDPAWSPDGRMIAFSSDRTGRRLIYLMDSRGEVQEAVSSIPGKSPAWSHTSR